MYQHEEVLNHFCELLVQTEHRVIVFCNEGTYLKLSLHLKQTDIDWVRKSNMVSLGKFIQTHLNILRSCDRLLVTTLERPVAAFLKLPISKYTIFIIHDANSFMAPLNHLFIRPAYRIKDFLRIVKYLLSGQWYYQKKLLQRPITLAFPNKTVLDYVKSNYNIPSNAKIIALPFSFYKGNTKQDNSKSYISIIVPCTVVSDIRNYECVLKAFQILVEKLEFRIKLIFLGNIKADGKYIIESFVKIDHPSFEFEYFTYTIPFVEYKTRISAADFLILPIKKYGRHGIVKERMGFTKISGSVNDLIRSGIPALISSTYPIEKELEILTDTYTNEFDLAEKIKFWITNKTYLNKNNIGKPYLDKFGEDTILNNLLKSLEI